MIKKYKLFLENKEEITLDDVFNNCKPFIEDLKKSKKGDFLLRGVGELKFSAWANKRSVDYNIEKFDAPNDRIPRNMPIDDHDEFNFLFNKKFGWNVRGGIFCFGYNLNKEGDIKDTGYGNKSFLMFPLGDYKLAYSPHINDLFIEYDDKQIPETVDGYKNTSLKNAIYYENEISIDCDEYYLVDQKNLNEIIERIWN